MPRNLYFSPFAFPFSFHDSPPTFSSRVSLPLFSVFVRSARRSFYSFPVFQEVSFVSPLHALWCCFFSSSLLFLTFFKGRTRDRRIHVAFSFSKNFTFVPWAPPNRWFCDVSRRDRFRVSRARVTRARHAITMRRLDHDVPA